jgi:hypothetical protein
VLRATRFAAPHALPAAPWQPSAKPGCCGGLFKPFFPTGSLSIASETATAGSHGLVIAREADWTGRLRGFWDLGFCELLLRPDAERDAVYKACSLPWNFVRLLGRVRFRGWLHARRGLKLD